MSTTDSWTETASPVGPLRLHSDGSALTAIEFAPFDEAVPGTRQDDAVLVLAREQLQEYFAGQRHDFDLPLAPVGTEFRRQVWAALQEIPYGRTVSYAQIAARLGLAPGASRAVGTANGANPIPIVVPCHRVIGADGSLTGYAGGLERKRTLLDLEGVASTPALF